MRLAQKKRTMEDKIVVASMARKEVSPHKAQGMSMQSQQNTETMENKSCEDKPIKRKSDRSTELHKLWKIPGDEPPFGKHPGDGWRIAVMRDDHIFIVRFPNKQIGFRWLQADQEIRDLAERNYNKAVELVEPPENEADEYQWWKKMSNNLQIITVLREWVTLVTAARKEYGWQRILPDIRKTLKQVLTIISLQQN